MIAAGSAFADAVLSAGTLTAAIGFTNPVFVDVDADGVFDPNGVP